ncbi:hypothetical protein DRP77_05435 [Candidatus Poribacteria bacterium]|nr:MAG: hypothetical protein DRP77_05435 [Candidatus Poribacteria bacterium]
MAGIKRVSVPISWMRCAAKVGRAIGRPKGVEGVTVNLPSGKAALTYIPGLEDLSEIKRALAEPSEERAEEAEDAYRLGLDGADHPMDLPPDGPLHRQDVDQAVEVLCGSERRGERQVQILRIRGLTARLEQLIIRMPPGSILRGGRALEGQGTSRDNREGRGRLHRVQG